jgi:hypothetical protein
MSKIDELEQRIAALEAERDECRCQSHALHRDVVASAAMQERIVDRHRTEADEVDQRWRDYEPPAHVAVTVKPGAPVGLLLDTRPPRLPRDDDGVQRPAPAGISIARDGGRLVMEHAAWLEQLEVDPQARDYVDAGVLVVEDLPVDEARLRVRRLAARGLMKVEMSDPR